MGRIFDINSGGVKDLYKEENRGENDYHLIVDVSLQYEKIYASKLHMNNWFQFKIIR